MMQRAPMKSPRTPSTDTIPRAQPQMVCPAKDPRRRVEGGRRPRGLERLRREAPPQPPRPLRAPRPGPPGRRWRRRGPARGRASDRRRGSTRWPSCRHVRMQMCIVPALQRAWPMEPRLIRACFKIRIAEHSRGRCYGIGEETYQLIFRARSSQRNQERGDESRSQPLRGDDAHGHVATNPRAGQAQPRPRWQRTC